MSNTVFKKTYQAPPISRSEILRYAGCTQGNDAIESLIDECLAELSDKLVFKVCYCVLPANTELPINFYATGSKMLEKYLSDCDKAVIFAATIGIEIDRLIAQNSIVSPAKALVFQAIGTERIEALCDAFCSDDSIHQSVLKPRISAGYGDLPLTFQKEIFRVLSPEKIGIALNDALLMSPSKSVTAIIGIRKQDGRI